MYITKTRTFDGCIPRTYPKIEPMIAQCKKEVVSDNYRGKGIKLAMAQCNKSDTYYTKQCLCLPDSNIQLTPWEENLHTIKDNDGVLLFTYYMAKTGQRQFYAQFQDIDALAMLANGRISISEYKDTYDNNQIFKVLEQTGMTKTCIFHTKYKGVIFWNIKNPYICNNDLDEIGDAPIQPFNYVIYPRHSDGTVSQSPELIINRSTLEYFECTSGDFKKIDNGLTASSWFAPSNASTRNMLELSLHFYTHVVEPTNYEVLFYFDNVTNTCRNIQVVPYDCQRFSYRGYSYTKMRSDCIVYAQEGNYTMKVDFDGFIL